MNDPATKDSASEIDPITKSAFDHEEKSTLPDGRSNHLLGEIADGPVMWAAPNLSGLGLRSRGPSAPGEARGVTNDQAVLQPQSVGAALATTGRSAMAQPLSSLSEPSERNVIEGVGVIAVVSKTKLHQTDGAFPTKGAGGANDDEAGRSFGERIERDEAFEIIKKARALLMSEKAVRQTRKDTPASEKTFLDYAKKCARIDAEIARLQEPWGHPIEVVMSRHAPTKQTFNAIRSALKRRALSRIVNLLKEQDAQQRAGDQIAQWTRTVFSLRAVLKEAEVIDGLDRQSLLDLTDKKMIRSFSKRQQLPRLKDGWQDKFLVLNESSPSYRSAGVLLRFCGLRPVELEKGVLVTVKEDLIAVEIQGGKVREGHAGQPWRRFSLKKEFLPSWFVHEVESDGSLSVNAAPDGLRSHLARLSEKLFPRKRKSGKRDVILSAYLFRHALVTEMREAGWDSADIAGVIGESTADTVRWYGLRARTGSVKPAEFPIVRDSLKTAVPVRPVDLSGLNRRVGKPDGNKKKLGR